ncbi:redoxin domain-containing protein [Natrarchaeobaculum sulfurireducens]|uniref:Peroxiredoxin n=1 Tax=Natrarchaeobaculum sulfurireducens TaxID=2044521 RepID=A0A346PLC2_9EURY|nr:redoxin domain-containing protein [Natrarchaeobaculum sulfurireducens]AXR76647.1 Peroxiredoxin [Natrarchaeobaculum sulfurireducens]AXR80317.1 peroxiredoxin [Natrarchaeobaculum sulfurireducens]
MVDFDVVELAEADHPRPGDNAPDFTRPLVTDEFWEDRTLSTLASEADGPTILVFTPMIGSFVGKYVWDELRDRDWDERAGRVIGVTISTPYAITRFLEDEDCPFAVFSDPTNAVAETYGVAHDLDDMNGLSEPRPAFFALESDLSVQAAWVASEWPEFPDYDDLEGDLGLE